MRALDPGDVSQMMTAFESSEARAGRAGAARESENLIDLIGGIYEAALDPEQWAGVLDALNGFINPGPDRFFPSGLHPREWFDAANAMLEEPADDLTSGRSMGRRAGAAEHARLRLAMVLRHVRRALHITEDITRSRAEAAALAETVDGLGAGLFIVDAATRILHLNAAARRLLAAEEVLCSRGGRLVACDPQANRSLRLAVTADSPADVMPAPLALIAANGIRRVGYVRPLKTAARAYDGRSQEAVAAVLVYKAGMECPRPPDIIARSYNLTPTELRVLLAIVDVGGTPQVAATLGIAPSTVRTHVGRLFEKTGTRRQAELVRLVAGFISPFQSE
ncbi:helix-turn-helix transcriptional regulator [Bradyrhizobium sp. CB3481]|uniref:helix-turn-helix transcriptional regulator n=1 Tax=Bradyrhizobium sp. CB3481 TaxID=3039158 RepID=UPI0024B14CCB|nr:helix-turn-helix transcriptional regulator [Bradyrhizobium sp. CB3481]WFU18580.1 helix-turn-helix transcriptional regulator [Bradyrhizobium sp. CB3481]